MHRGNIGARRRSAVDGLPAVDLARAAAQIVPRCPQIALRCVAHARRTVRATPSGWHPSEMPMTRIHALRQACRTAQHAGG